MLRDRSHEGVTDTCGLLNTDVCIKTSINTPFCRIYATRYSKSGGIGRLVTMRHLLYNCS